MYKPGLGAMLDFGPFTVDPVDTTVDVVGRPEPSAPPRPESPFDFEAWLAANKTTVYAVAGSILLLAVLKGRR